MANDSILYYHSAPPFSRTKFLQAASDEVCYSISNMCLQFAILGYTSVAFRLLDRMNKHEKHGGHHDIVRPLWLLWDLLGEWPAGEKERVKEEIVRVRRKNGEERSRKQAKLELEGQDVADEDVKAYIDELAQGFREGWYWPGRANRGDGEKVPFGKELSPADIKKAKDAVWKAIDESFEPAYRDSTSGNAAMDISSGLVGALDLSISIREADETSTEAILERIATRLDANQAIRYLVQSRRAWSILKNGVLAKSLSLDAKKLDDFATDIEELVEERLENGRLEIEDQPMKEILDMIDNNTRNSTEAQAASSGPLPDTLFHDPATDSQINEAEKRLGVELPSDYAEFLRISNGLEEPFGGIGFEPSYFPVEEARWLADDEEYFTDLTIDIPGEVLYDIPRDYKHDDIENWPRVGKALEIGCEEIDNLWLIPPVKVQEVQKHVANILKDDSGHPETVKEVVRKICEDFAGSMDKWNTLDWCCTTWAAGSSASMVSYPSFKAYLRKVAENSGSSEVDVLNGRKFFGYFCREDVAQE